MGTCVVQSLVQRSGGHPTFFRHNVDRFTCQHVVGISHFYAENVAHVQWRSGGGGAAQGAQAPPSALGIVHIVHRTASSSTLSRYSQNPNMDENFHIKSSMLDDF